MPELHRVVPSPREGRDERLEAGQIDVHGGRQLPQDRVEAVAERLDPFDEPGEPVLGVEQATHVGQVPAPFDHEAEGVGHPGPPALDGLDGRQAVEGVVDLDDGNVAA
jgi:hypothetical protein